MKSILFTVLFCASFSFSTDFNIPMTKFTVIEFTDTKIIFQTESGGRAQVGGGSNALQIDQIEITPPVGKENQWLSLVLAAVASGKVIRINGTVNGSAIVAAGASARLRAVFQ